MASWLVMMAWMSILQGADGQKMYSTAIDSGDLADLLLDPDLSESDRERLTCP